MPMAAQGGLGHSPVAVCQHAAPASRTAWGEELRHRLCVRGNSDAARLSARYKEGRQQRLSRWTSRMRIWSLAASAPHSRPIGISATRTALITQPFCQKVLAPCSTPLRTRPGRNARDRRWRRHAAPGRPGTRRARPACSGIRIFSGAGGSLERHRLRLRELSRSRCKHGAVECLEPLQDKDLGVSCPSAQLEPRFPERIQENTLQCAVIRFTVGFQCGSPLRRSAGRRTLIRPVARPALEHHGDLAQTDGPVKRSSRTVVDAASARDARTQKSSLRQT